MIVCLAGLCKLCHPTTIDVDINEKGEDDGHDPSFPKTHVNLNFASQLCQIAYYAPDFKPLPNCILVILE